jgi:hypothetical protein
MTSTGRARLSVAEGERRWAGQAGWALPHWGERKGKGVGPAGPRRRKQKGKGKGKGNWAGPRGERERGREKDAHKCI